MQGSVFVGRTDGQARLTSLLTRAVRDGGDLRIMSVEGPGGVGKSALVRKTLSDVGVLNRRYMQLAVSRNYKRQSDTQTLQGIIHELATSATGGAFSHKPPGHYFPETMESIRTLQTLQSEIVAEMQGKGISPDSVVQANSVLKGIIGVYDSVSSVSPKVREFVDPVGLNSATDKIDANAQNIAALATESLKFFDYLGLSSAKNRRNMARTNPELLLAQALITDLKPLLIGKHQKKMMPGHGNMPGVERLLIVLEDYESLAPLMQSFLLGSFLPLLQTSSLDVTVLIIGRDRLSSTGKPPAFSGQQKRS